MENENLLKKAVKAFNALSPAQQMEMMEEQRKSFAENNVALSRSAPAATDTGLVTVAEITQGWNINYVENPPSPPIGTKFVDRSKAEALLLSTEIESKKLLAAE